MMIYPANFIKALLLFFILAFSANPVFAQETDSMLDAYQSAENMLWWNLNDKIFNASVTPNQINEDYFWYTLTTRQGNEFFLVDVVENSKTHAFNHERLAGAIESEPEIAEDPWNLNLRNLVFSDDLHTIRFEKNRNQVECSIETYNCEVTGSVIYPEPFSVVSPNGKFAVYTYDYNFWVQNLETDEHTQLTFDGVEYYSYGTDNQGWTRSERPILKWSPDSKKIATFRLDERDVGKMTLWRTQTGRPEADIWPYAIPGDTIVPMLERVIIDVENAQTIWLNTEPDHQRASNCCGLTREGNLVDIEWSDDSGKFSFVSTSRDYKDVNLRIADAETGNVQEIYHERDELFFESNLTSRGIPNWRVLHDSNEFIWFTRKNNWGHLYLHDLETGQLKNQITDGSWNVIDILHINPETREIMFSGVGREEGRDPYFVHLYKINFDGSGLTLLTPENANHSVDINSNGTWFVDTFSTFEVPPKSVLRNANGELLMELEHADIDDLLETGWKTPVPFSVKARDGETDLYGIMVLPSDFDENKSYPIVNSIYPGPQSGSLGSRSFSASHRGNAHALAELGFVVVAIDALGSSPMRSREFHTYYHGDMMDNGLPDQIAGMKQLAERFSFIDIERAGIYGHSGGGFATSAALLQYPEFFKAGVSGAGNHDNRGYTYYWGENTRDCLNRKIWVIIMKIRLCII